jgi:RNA recognition motif-containing protein
MNKKRNIGLKKYIFLLNLNYLNSYKFLFYFFNFYSKNHWSLLKNKNFMALSNKKINS